MFQALNCPNCGAPLAPAGGNQVITCGYCKTTFKTSTSPTPEPDMGDLMLGANLSSKHIPGWELINEENLSFVNTPRPGLQAYFASSSKIQYLLTSSGWFDDFDVSVSLRFTSGDEKYVRGGLLTRYINTEGGYIFFVSAQSTYKIAYYANNDKKELEWYDIKDWTYHGALHGGMNQDNRIRVICNQEKLRVYFNGVLAFSISDKRFSHGQVRLAVEPSNKSDITAVFTDLQVREVIK